MPLTHCLVFDCKLITVLGNTNPFVFPISVIVLVFFSTVVAIPIDSVGRFIALRAFASLLSLRCFLPPYFSALITSDSPRFNISRAALTQTGTKTSVVTRNIFDSFQLQSVTVPTTILLGINVKRAAFDANPLSKPLSGFGLFDRLRLHGKFGSSHNLPVSLLYKTQITVN
jgi:hypothetical protein